MLLEPGIDPLTEDEILAFFDMTQVPVEMEALDLSHFKTALDKILEP